MTTRPVWTVLIPTLGRRRGRFEALLSGLMPQVDAADGRVTVLALWNNGERPLPQVRQDLADAADAQYISFVDDDDELPGYYVSKVLPLLDGNVHYIGWRMQYIKDGQWHKPTFHSLRYRDWHDDEDGYYRDITHLNPVRLDLVRKHASFTAAWPEDHGWAAQLRGYLLTEQFIDDIMYVYRFSTGDSTYVSWTDSNRWNCGPAAPEGTRPVIASPNFAWHPASAA